MERPASRRPALHLMLVGASEMEHIERARCAPECCGPEQIPKVDDARPTRCPSCCCPARVKGRIVLQGHGMRTRLVVVLAALGGHRRELVECWVRRYRCVKCRAVANVLPRGVLPRYLYSVGAIVVAMLLVTSPPVGKGLSDAGAHERQGMLGFRTWGATSPYRWTSLRRWGEVARKWWPGLALSGVSGLLTGLMTRAGSDDAEAIIKEAINAHVCCGAAP